MLTPAVPLGPPGAVAVTAAVLTTGLGVHFLSGAAGGFGGAAGTSLKIK